MKQYKYFYNSYRDEIQKLDMLSPQRTEGAYYVAVDSFPNQSFFCFDFALGETVEELENRFMFDAPSIDFSFGEIRYFYDTQMNKLVRVSRVPSDHIFSYYVQSVDNLADFNSAFHVEPSVLFKDLDEFLDVSNISFVDFETYPSSMRL